MKKTVLFVLAIIVILCSITSQAQPFVHPGGLHKKSDLERMKYMVVAKINPWYSSYLALKANSRASFNYRVLGDTTKTVITRDSPNTNLNSWYSDANAAYYNALMWAITGNTKYAAKSVQIFKAWSNLKKVTGGGTESLNGGLLGYLMIEAAEIIQSTYPAWDSASKQAFKDMLVYPGYSTTTVPPSLSDTNGTFYWRIYLGDPGRHGNQDLAGIRTMLAMGVFLDNRTMYERALRYYEGLPHLPNDFPFATGPCRSTSLVSSTSYNDSYNYTRSTKTPDYGYNGVLTNYFWENGQCQESSRDQGHTTLGGSLCQCISEIAWNQGDDLYSLANNKLLQGLDYMTKYNTSYITSFPDQLIPWEPTAESGEYIQGWDRTHRWYSKRINPWADGDTTRLTRGYNSILQPVWEMAIAHYSIRQGLAADSVKWITRARDLSYDSIGYESHAPGTNDADHPGFGTLTCRRPLGCAGDPINSFTNNTPVFAMNVLPGRIQAENFDYYTGSGEGHSYHDLSKSNLGGKYRTDADVDVDTCSEGGYALTNIQDCEWVTYTVYIPATGKYGIRIRYAAADGNGKIKFAFNDTAKTTEVAIPFGAPYSTGLTDWKDFIVIPSVTLAAGVQSMRVYVGGSQSFQLNYIDVLTAAVLPVSLISFTTQGNANKSILVKWTTALEANNSNFILQHSTNGQSFTPIATLPSVSNNGNYQFEDKNPSAGINYYQLVQIDATGNKTYLGIREVSLNQSENKSIIYPNPVKGKQFYLRLNNIDSGIAHIQIMDLSGRLLQSFTKNNLQHGQLITINLSRSLPAGSYVVKVNGHSQTGLLSVE